MRLSRVLVGLAAVVAAGAAAPAATAATLPLYPVQLRNVDTDNCLEVQDGGDLYANPCTGAPNQTWLSNGSGSAQNPMTGLCLQNNGNGDAVAVECDGNPRQQWDDQDRNWLFNPYTGACLADGDGYVYTTSCDSYPTESWIAEQQ
ncbi:RICIN domain-containing protein [Actinocrispum wychmicini]|uniref:Ricin-type beta-trefoil lectin protein n=1 Tax=Actinocrispum wychmicini TaxID=1213861 RepID=A0A4R2JGE3_9PSEU|nr:ricin-type beta-trefoil lectin domain protein [Actinocrispum wychmicini]TCO55986.1 ricin-type beta-trefoil lectin protein [Actinocrispum wychmicini]